MLDRGQFVVFFRASVRRLVNVLGLVICSDPIAANFGLSVVRIQSCPD